MSSFLNQQVLVLNRLWQAVNICTARRALTLLFQGHAQVVLGDDDGAFQTFMERQSGGLKALVAAERVARRPDSAPDTRGEQARDKLRAAPGGTLADIATDGEFALVLTRRSASGEVEALAAIDDPAMLERAIRRAAG